MAIQKLLTKTIPHIKARYINEDDCSVKKIYTASLTVFIVCAMKQQTVDGLTTQVCP